jgi:serine/threonine-protein kinase HipA
LTTYVPSPQVSESALRLFKLWCLNYALRNADAHLKNYALTYTSHDDVALAPVYDIVTVTAYPEFENDIPALTVSGRKVWRAGTLLQQAGAVRLSLTKAQMNACVEEIIAAMEATAPDVRRYSDEYPQFRDVAKRVLMAWDVGMLDLSPTATPKSKPESKLVTESGLSGPKNPRRRAKNPYKDDGPLSSKIR